MIAQFTNGMMPMQAAKARKALETSVRVNGAESMTRAELVELRTLQGASVVLWHGEKVLRLPDGAFLDTRNITATGIAYAEYLLATDAKHK